MQFLIMAYDAKDPGTMERRMKVRNAHLATIARYQRQGHMHIGAAMLDDTGKMIGSCIIAEFPTHEALEAWIAEEPYVTGNVWGSIQVMPCKIGPSFLKTPSDP